MKKKLFLLAFFSLLNVFPQSGTLDPAFGTTGKVVTGFGRSEASVNSVAVQPDGKIICAGNLFCQYQLCK